MSRYCLFFISFWLLGSFSYSQKKLASLSGKVVQNDGNPVPGVTLLLEGTSIGAVADIEGTYEIVGIAPGTYTIAISGIGYKKTFRRVDLPSSLQVKLNIVLEVQAKELDELVVYGKSEATEMREKAYAIQVVEAKEFKNISTDVNQILNKVSGVNIRQDGGLGSAFSLSLNGLTGNQVKTFIDGIPMDYFGSSLTLNNFPANIISGIEIYKGVVPIHLSSDALGGAINIITDKRPMSYIDASYSHGSFNTHRGAINGQLYNKKSGATFRLKSFYNYSDNDYKIDVNLLDVETGKLSDETTEVRRFHDSYESRMVWMEGGITHKRFADELMVGIMYSDNFNDLQQPPQALGTTAIPLGEVIQEEAKWITNLSYQKKGLIGGKMNVSSFLVYVNSQFNLKDTSSHRYDWMGNREENVHTTTGEVERKTLFQLDRSNLLGNINTEYEILPNHNVSANLSFNSMTLEGTDELHAQKNTQFSKPSTVNKSVAGLAYTTKLLSSKLHTTVFGKWYQFGLNTTETDYSGTEEIDFTSNASELGYGFASTYFVRPGFQLKASFESAYRFPETEELFGNGISILPNIFLEPEKSKNYNLGLRYNFKPTKNNNLQTDINLFLRDSEDFMRTETVGVRSTFENQASVLATGVDMNIQYMLKNNLRFSLNGTYQDLRNNGKWVKGREGSQPDPFYEDRIPNQPYLFGNLAASYNFSEVFSADDNFSISAIQNYVHEFFFNWPSLANSSTKAVIPTQFTSDLELVYTKNNGKYNLSFTAANILNERVFDNLNQQKPGRSFAIKARIFLTQNLN
ncbi:TonB-dependent receptor [Fulvivirga sp. M361]|uniref:TonB-dependent receptor n=1 Tax=Fulvivirga sp. M361 TaxID=2594266 RepID=UPI00117BAB25|nr:TonB-dependent receptor [Fulvivirga sp. M361]TRX60730.1 TonB-dependent receptor [Fulvivirga sp. M361]